MNTQRCYGGVRVLDAPSMDDVRRLDYGAVPFILKMQRNGLLIDVEHFRRFSAYLKSEEERLTDEIHKSGGYRVNPGSPDQVEELLFRQIGLKPPAFLRKTKSGKRLSVDDEALSSIKSLHPCVPLVQEFTECHKLRTSYADVLPTLTGPDGRIRTSLRITRQVSGRISSSDPNLMAQPTRTDLGKKIREGFVAPKGRKLGIIDQSQIEMRVLSHASGCAAMTDTFLRDADIHSETACRIFFAWLIKELGRMPTKTEAEAAGMNSMRHRYPAKRIGFGTVFGITPEGLQDQIRIAQDPTWTERERRAFVDYWTIERCAETIETWFGTYPEVRSYMEGEYASARRFGYVWDLFGRIRWIPEVKSVHRWITEAGCRQAGNFKIQSSATGTMKLFMAECNDRLLEGAYVGAIDPLLAIHDEVLVEGDASAIDDFMADAGNVMERVIRLDVPIRYNTAVGDSWGEMEK